MQSGPDCYSELVKEWNEDPFNPAQLLGRANLLFNRASKGLWLRRYSAVAGNGWRRFLPMVSKLLPGVIRR